jgi:uncharacterized damage-inducible protein DinB
LLPVSELCLRIAAGDAKLDPIIRLFTRMRSKTIELLDNMPPEHLKLQSPDVRTLGEIFAHVHNSLCDWMEGIDRRWKCSRLPEEQEHDPAALRGALVDSGNRLTSLFSEADHELLRRDVGHVGTGADFVGYMVVHEAHHHGEMAIILLENGHRELFRKLWYQGDEIK